MSSSPIHLALWLIQPILQAAVAILMYRRGLHKAFPVFFAYMPVQIGIFCIGFPVYRWAGPMAFLGVPLYFWTYCILTSIDLIFNFKILHEIFLDIFHPYSALKDLGDALFKWGALIMILVSVVLISATPGWGDPVTRTLYIAQRSTRLVQCGMLVFLLAFCKSLGVSWRRLSFGLAVGFGVLAAVELMGNALYNGNHMSFQMLNTVDMAAGDVGLMFWLTYSAWNQKKSPAPVLIPQRWDEALTELRPQADSESLIPMFENMVDRAFSKVQDIQS